MRQVCFVLKHQRQQLLSALVHIFHMGKNFKEKKVESKLIWIASCQQSFLSVIERADQSPLAVSQVSQLLLKMAEFHLSYALSKTSTFTSKNRGAMTTFFLALLCSPNPNENMPVAFSPKKMAGGVFILKRYRSHSELSCFQDRPLFYLPFSRLHPGADANQRHSELTAPRCCINLLSQASVSATVIGH